VKFIDDLINWSIICYRCFKRLWETSPGRSNRSTATNREGI